MHDIHPRRADPLQPGMRTWHESFWLDLKVHSWSGMLAQTLSQLESRAAVLTGI